MAHALLAILLVSGVPELRDPVDVVSHRLADKNITILNARKSRDCVHRANGELHGRIVDFTHNNGSDNRIYSAILCEKRDLYVYLPPCYDPGRKYPFILWLHGGFGDETAFARTAAIGYLDRLIASGCFPPVIVVAPDATIKGEDGIFSRHSFFVNGVCGRYEDHLLQEVLPFAMGHFSIAPEREAHVVNGYSAGGFPAMGIAIKHRELFATVVSIAGPLNMRYWNCKGRYFENFSPCTFRWQTEYRPRQKITRYYGGLVHLPAKFFVRPIFGDNPGVMELVLANNPADLLISQNLQPGELDIYIAYAGQDNFNFDAHNESFLWLARQQGVEATVRYSPSDRHTAEYCTQAQMRAYDWLSTRIPTATSGHISEPRTESDIPIESP